MERLTIPDVKIDGGMKRVILDSREVRAEALSLYWALKEYEDTGLTAEQIYEIDHLFAEKCRELAELRKKESWIPVEKQLPEPHTDVLVAVVDVREDEASTFIDCLVENNERLTWSTFNGARERVLAWRLLPETYHKN